jgi:hypothetical protein
MYECHFVLLSSSLVMSWGWGGVEGGGQSVGWCVCCFIIFILLLHFNLSLSFRLYVNISKYVCTL